jgi:DNA-binding XRE family transcriptional regulator
MLLLHRVDTAMVTLHNEMREITLARKPSFGQYLRDTRIKRGLSAVDVAEQIGVSTASIYFSERDHCRPRDKNLCALCKALKLPARATKAMAAG